MDRFATATRLWKGWPGGQPSDAAIRSAKNASATNVRTPATPTHMTSSQSRKVSTTRPFVRGCLSRYTRTAAITKARTKHRRNNIGDLHRDDAIGDDG